MNFTKRGKLLKANEMKLRATGLSTSPQQSRALLTLSADSYGENGIERSFYIQFSMDEAEQIINSWSKMLSEYKNNLPVS